MWADYAGEVPVSQARLAELMNIGRSDSLSIVAARAIDDGSPPGRGGA